MKPTFTRRGAVSVVAAVAVSSPAAVLAAGQSPDPVFAEIEEHRRLKSLSDAAFKIIPQVGEADFPLIYEAEEYAGDRQEEHFDQLGLIMEMTPTTAAGAVAVLTYIGAYVQGSEAGNSCGPFHGWSEHLREPGETFISRVAAVLAANAVQS